VWDGVLLFNRQHALRGGDGGRQMDGANLLTGSETSVDADNYGLVYTQQTVLYQDSRKLLSDKSLYGAVKRIMDVTVSLLGILTLSVVFIAAALAIVLEDGGPVLYMQKRIGKKGREFEIYKFRSMYRNADAVHENLRKQYRCEEVSFKLQDDPRVTKVGRVLRKFNIDELPQLINILKGDMSLVGPRPLPVYEYEDEQRKYGNRYIERYLVPQGLTCIWQISNRASVDFETRMQMDVEYARKRGFLMDLKLVVKTLIFTLTGKASY